MLFRVEFAPALDTGETVPYRWLLPRSTNRSTSGLQTDSRRNRRSCRASKRGFRPVLEPLERRVLLAVEPLTLTDPMFWGDSGFSDPPGGGFPFSANPRMSADGQVIVFESAADNLVPNELNDNFDVFVYNRGTGRVSLVSENSTRTSSATTRSASASPASRATPPNSTAAPASAAAAADATRSTDSTQRAETHLIPHWKCAASSRSTKATRRADWNSANGNDF